MMDFLKAWPYTPTQLETIRRTLEAGKTVRTTHQPDIASIYPSDDGYTVVIIGVDGREREREFKQL
jgi:hypothetical protein